MQQLKTFVLWMMILGFLLPNYAQPASSIRLTPLSQFDAAIFAVKLKSKLPPGATMDIAEYQEFLLQSAGMNLKIAPIILHPHGQEAEPTQCGVFFANPKEETAYLPIVDKDFSMTDMCQEVIAVGVTSNREDPPRLLFIFGVNSGHGPDNTLTYLLDWNAKSNMYEVNEKTSAWLSQQRGSETIAGARRLLARHKP